MDGPRCLVEVWADFGDLLSANVMSHGADVILSTGSNDVFIFSGQERKVKTVLQFDSPVTSLALSADQCSLYVLCDNHHLYCTPLSLGSSSLSKEQDDDPALSVVSRDSVLVNHGDVLSFNVAEGILVTAILQESFWTFHLYELQPSSNKFKKHAVLKFPAVKGLSHNDVDVQDRMSSAPTLTFIYPNSSPKAHACKRHPCLDPLLFRILFGVDASLINSPIILCGLPDGRLVFFPLLLPALASSRGESPIRVFYSLEQPIAFIGTSVTGDQGAQCLVVIGQRGKILLVTANQRSSDGTAADSRFIEHFVPGPVVCACVEGERLYYSTGTNLFCLSLDKTVALSSSSTSITAGSDGDSRKPENAVCLNVCRVIALTEPSVSPAGSVQLLAVSLSGRLLHVTLPQDVDKANMSRLASSQAGQKIKDLLARIGNVWERATIEKQQQELKNHTLMRLNHVLHVCHLLSRHEKYDRQAYDHQCDHQPPISCQAAAKWSTLLQKDSLVLTCVLENQSSCVLDQGWTLCLQVQSSLPLSAGGSSRTFSFALTKLDCGQKAEVTIPLESDSDLFLPVQIHCSLVYTLQTLLNPEEYRQLSTSDTSLSQLLTHTGCICLALNTLTLDWLDALRIEEPNSNGHHIPKQISIWDATRVLLSSKRIPTDEPAMPKAAPYTVAIHISSELLRNWHSLHECSSALLCISVLRWLLCGKTAKTEGQEVVQTPVVCAKGPDRQAVRLLTKEVILSDFHTEGPLPVVEVQIESVSMSAVCGLHHAVLRRVQAFLRDPAVKPDKPAELRGQSLCEAVQHMEHLYKELQDLRDPADGVMKTKRISESLLQLYLQLREKPLVIL
ncbi:Fanconi anemia core complex-associated protein 100 [Clarias gariepinus]|uniref:Fanconi anemia core complex-associated protein 100 n=1 Tax=Clarias gariepinus TaxID=13013 RepID=UPI00234DBC2D|nr:Fanconi anemia core complex-associated protein 100 [Clarias gariepinus]